MPGLTGAHLLKTDTPRVVGQTTEQQIRGGDAAADRIILLSGYDAAVVQSVVSDQFSAEALHLLGAEPAVSSDSYMLGFSLTQADIGGI